MIRLAVKTLSGGTEVVVEVPESSTVSQLKIQLSEKDGRFKGCRLLLQVSYSYCWLRMNRCSHPGVCIHRPICKWAIGPDQGKGCYWWWEMTHTCFLNGKKSTNVQGALLHNDVMVKDLDLNNSKQNYIVSLHQKPVVSK